MKKVVIIIARIVLFAPASGAAVLTGNREFMTGQRHYNREKEDSSISRNIPPGIQILLSLIL